MSETQAAMKQGIEDASKAFKQTVKTATGVELDALESMNSDNE